MASKHLDNLKPLMRRVAKISTTIPLIIGITIGGALVFTWVAILVVFFLQRHHRREIAKFKDTEAINLGGKVAIPLQNVGNPEIISSERSSTIPTSASTIPKKWLEDDSMKDSPPMDQSKSRILSQKGMFQISRDSWPLNGSMPNVSLRLLQPNSSLVTLNQVGGGGYVLPPDELTRPGRTHSRKSSRSSTKVVVSMEEPHLQRFSTISSDQPSVPHRPQHHRRSASENQLSTILRSTSQRLKSVHRKSLSRTLTFTQSPRPPPGEKPQAPQKLVSESREVLLEPIEVKPVVSVTRSPSPSPTSLDKGKKVARSGLKRSLTTTPSLESFESLCADKTPDLIIPGPLRSPDKKFAKARSPQRHTIRLSTATGEDLAKLIEDRATKLGMEAQNTNNEVEYSTSPHRISLASDPFYSNVKRSKRALPQTKVGGPRPLYMRNTTFGSEATAERPASFASSSSSPLRNISGNARSSSRPGSSTSISTSASTSNSNPFSWEPQEATTKSTSLSSPRPNSRKKGHKRNHLVRISLIPPPQSVCPVLEEEEDASPLRFNIPLSKPNQIYEPKKSPSPKPMSTPSSRLTTRPPSIATFDPMIKNPALVASTLVPAENSPTLGYNHGLQIYSPTLAVMNYYSDETSEDEFFNQNAGRVLPRPKMAPKPHSVSHFPHPEHKELFSFSPLTSTPKPKPHASFPPLRSGTATPSLLTSPPSLPAPPVLTQPLHPNGPRTEQVRRPESSRSVLNHSIYLLRRMNSEVSHSSIATEESRGGSPRSITKTSPSPSMRTWGGKDRQSRGSRAYLNIGDQSHRSRIAKGQSAREQLVEKMKIREEDENGLEDWERKGLAKVRRRRSDNPELEPDLTAEDVKQEPVEEEQFNFPKLGPEDITGTAQELPPRKDSLTTELTTPTSPSQGLNLKAARWSDATPSPTIRVIRHESQLIQPVPQTAPLFGWNREKGKMELEGVEDVKENMVLEGQARKKDNGNWNGNYGRPDSLGLYDAEGFLKNSPVPKYL